MAYDTESEKQPLQIPPDRLRRAAENYLAVIDAGREHALREEFQFYAGRVRPDILDDAWRLRDLDLEFRYEAEQLAYMLNIPIWQARAAILDLRRATQRNIAEEVLERMAGEVRRPAPASRPSPPPPRPTSPTQLKRRTA
jgi:hypothetical protein